MPPKRVTKTPPKDGKKSLTKSQKEEAKEFLSEVSKIANAMKEEDEDIYPGVIGSLHAAIEKLGEIANADVAEDEEEPGEKDNEPKPMVPTKKGAKRKAAEEDVGELMGGTATVTKGKKSSDDDEAGSKPKGRGGTLRSLRRRGSRRVTRSSASPEKKSSRRQKKT